MELIYLYIEKYGGFISKQGLSLSNNFKVELRDKNLIVRKNKNILQNFYGDKITSISVFVGKNGSGKTTVLDILGMTRNDRLINSVVENTVTDEYLLLYHLGCDDDGSDLFGIELIGENILDNMMTNYIHTNDSELYDKEKTSIGKVYKYQNDTFISLEHHFFDYRLKHNGLNYKLHELIKYAYIGEKYRYSNRIKHLKQYNEGNSGYISDRNFYSQPSMFQKYITLTKCINGEIKGFDCDKAEIVFEDEIDYEYSFKEKKLEIYKEYFSCIEQNLFIFNGIYSIRLPKQSCSQLEK